MHMCMCLYVKYVCVRVYVCVCVRVFVRMCVCNTLAAQDYTYITHHYCHQFPSLF